jgi:hypothetical protein
VNHPSRRASRGTVTVTRTSIPTSRSRLFHHRPLPLHACARAGHRRFPPRSLSLSLSLLAYLLARRRSFSDTDEESTRRLLRGRPSDGASRPWMRCTRLPEDGTVFDPESGRRFADVRSPRNSSFRRRPRLKIRR